jgi:thioesterase domain-containing protein
MTTLDAGVAPAASAMGVRVRRLRPGTTGETLFLVPGLAGDTEELIPLAAALTGPQEVYAVAPYPTAAAHGTVLTMETIAAAMVAEIRQLQPVGPYRLGGYSFGAMLALEMAQQLGGAGEVVQPLILIEAIYDERYWPRGIWVRAIVRRTARQLRRIAGLGPREGLAELRLRAGRLVQRVVRRNAEAPDPLLTQAPDDGTFVTFAYAALAGYRPRFYDGRATLIASVFDRHFGCDTAKLWAGYFAHLDLRSATGDHLTVMQDAASAGAIAGVIDHRLALARDDWIGLRPVPGFARPMILTTMRWFSSARLAQALVEAGFAVSACRPRAHAIQLVDGLTCDTYLNRLGQLRSIAAAIRKARPDIVLPGDEHALVLLRRLYARARTADPELAALVAYSLGGVEEWPSIETRSGLAELAAQIGVPVPDTEVVADAGALTDWAAKHDLPAVLKTDGSWGGRGVAIVNDAVHLPQAFRRLSTRPRLWRAVKRTVVNREAGSLGAWLRHRRPVVNAQRYVKGREAIVTAASVNGETSALVCLEVMSKSPAKGPATVVRVIDHPALAEAARRMVRRLGLSGFSGFDFILAETGEPQLLELNPRLTPTSHLLVEDDYRRDRTLVMFPAEHPVDAPEGELDLPVRAPSLVALGERLMGRRPRRLTRVARQLGQKLTDVPY